LKDESVQNKHVGVWVGEYFTHPHPVLDVVNGYLYRKDEYDRKALAIVQQHKISRT
jgi:hypothetical protein